ncbi:MAG: hypothetical protein GY821_09955 [Gammaproteobacteria bacterium]|nr:hypothetical protein [Gammaproteobacteria bacterium]
MAALRQQLDDDPERVQAIAAALIEAASKSTRAGVEAASKVMDRVDGPVARTLDEDTIAALRPHVAIIAGALPNAIRPELPRGTVDDGQVEGS